jgi:Bacterial RNA polymerase, alpha chain C terminal domain/Sigma-70, region 4
MSTRTAEITPSQAKFLSQSVDEVDLSVRASNCLKNINVKCLGELIQYSPAELIRVQNFGQKSLDEIIALFARENLSLGLSIPGWAPERATISVASAVKDQPTLNTAQCTLLAKRLDEIDLSVRTSNCLNTLNIKYLGELIQYTPAKLMQIHAFGKKSLQELKALFATVKLPLGLQIPEWTPDLVGPISIEATNLPTIGEPEKDWPTPTQKAFLARRLSQFHLSDRVAAIVQASGIVRVGDLAIRSPNDAKTLVGSDQAALRELTGLLASEQLHFGVTIPGWSSEIATDWEQAFPAEMHGIRGRHALPLPDTSTADLQRLEDELENLVRLTSPSVSDRNLMVVSQFFGFDGTGKKTLEEVGQSFGVTRERVRQIVKQFTKRLHRRSLYLPIFRLACNHILESLPNTPRAVSQSLHAQQITKTEFDVTGIVAIVKLLGEQDLFDNISIGEVTLAVKKDEAGYFKRVPRIARAIVSAFGCGHIEHILSDLDAASEQTVDALQVTTILGRNPDVRWLNQEREWFTIIETKRNRLSNIVRKVLSVAQKISISELRGAIKRVHRLDGFAPPSDILRSFCSSLPFCDVVDEHVISNQALSLTETLGEIESCFYDVLREHGPAMSLNALREECLQRGMNANSFYQYITYSPIICRLVREVYALVGADVPPGAVEEIPQSSAKAPVLIGHGWTDDGRIWISYRLNASNVRNGMFTLPSALKGLVGGPFSIQSSGTGSRTIISAEGDRLTGLHRPIAIRGGQPDDVIIVAFDIRHGSADVRFGEETAGSSEATSDVTALGSLAATATNQESRTPLITGDDLTGDDKEWQPISNAPVGQELEVRLEDPFGRYVLLFPCKLIPGQGWINSRLETPLPADPVDWRHWDDLSIRF